MSELVDSQYWGTVEEGVRNWTALNFREVVSGAIQSAGYACSSWSGPKQKQMIPLQSHASDSRGVHNLLPAAPL